MKFFVVCFSLTEGKHILLAFEQDESGALDFAADVDGVVLSQNAEGRLCIVE